MLIAFGHKKRSGKDVAARYLVERYGFHRIAFADNLKKAAEVMCGFTHLQLNGSYSDKESMDPYWGFSPRYFLKHFGTEVTRNFSEDFWVKSLGLVLNGLRSQGITNIVISDLRFINEAAFVKKEGGFCVKIVRDSKPDVVSDTHSSEVSLDGYEYDRVLYNNSDLRSFYDEIDLLYSSLIRREC